MEELKCCFTGHRPQKITWLENEHSPQYCSLKEYLYDLLEKFIGMGYQHFISGMALGGDTLFAQVVLHLKERYPQIKLECALPCLNQARFWTDEQKVRYRALLEKADIVNYISQNYSYQCMMLRNYYMVNQSSLVVAMWNGIKEGGTWRTAQYAKQKHKSVYQIPVRYNRWEPYIELSEK